MEASRGGNQNTDLERGIKMKHIHKAIMCLTIFCLVASVTGIAFSAEIQNTDKADTLKALNLFKGTENGYELDTNFTRAQGTAMIIRLLGLEASMETTETANPFTDFSQDYWGQKYIAFAYSKGIVHGTSETTFDPESEMTGNEFITLVLRALGYRDASPDNAATVAVDSGLLSSQGAQTLASKEVFLRDDMVGVAFNALQTKLKDSPKTLLQKLVEDDKCVVEDAAKSSGLYKESDPMDKIEHAIIDELNTEGKKLQ